MGGWCGTPAPSPRPPQVKRSPAHTAGVQPRCTGPHHISNAEAHDVWVELELQSGPKFVGCEVRRQTRVLVLRQTMRGAVASGPRRLWTGPSRQLNDPALPQSMQCLQTQPPPPPPMSSEQSTAQELRSKQKCLLDKAFVGRGGWGFWLFFFGLSGTIDCSRLFWCFRPKV